MKPHKDRKKKKHDQKQGQKHLEAVSQLVSRFQSDRCENRDSFHSCYRIVFGLFGCDYKPEKCGCNNPQTDSKRGVNGPLNWPRTTSQRYGPKRIRAGHAEI